MSAVGRLLVSSRPLSWVNTALPFAAAYYFGGGGFDPAMLAIALFFLVPYNLLMYGVNDVFDWLPLAAVIEDKIICLHGGIGVGFGFCNFLGNAAVCGEY